MIIDKKEILRRMKEGVDMRMIIIVLLSFILLGCAAEQANKVDYDVNSMSDQQIKRNLQDDPWGCPYCGALGSEIERVYATSGKIAMPYLCTYRCKNGHTWKKECL
jgi:hypothetical protein